MSLICMKKASPVEWVGFLIGSFNDPYSKNPCQSVQSVAESLSLGVIMFMSLRGAFSATKQSSRHGKVTLLTRASTAFLAIAYRSATLRARCQRDVISSHTLHSRVAGHRTGRDRHGRWIG